MGRLLAVVILVCGFAHAGWAQNSENKKKDPYVSARLVASPTRVYEHSVFDLTLEITSRNVQFGPNFNLNPLPDESVLKLSSFAELEPKRTQKDGIVTEVRRFRCQAEVMKPGPINISPKLQFTMLIRQRTVYMTSTQRVGREIQVRPLRLTALPIPAQGRPKDYSGAVGRFDLKVDLSPTSVAVEELVTATTRITGKGYLDDITLPQLQPGRHFLAYTPEVMREPGSIVMTQTIIPQSTNAAVVSPLSFCFFDPISGQYRTITRGPFTLTFHQETAQTNAVPYRSAVARPGDAASGLSGVRGEALTTAEHARSQAFRALGIVLTGVGGILVCIGLFYTLRGLRKTLPGRRWRPALVTWGASILFISAGILCGQTSRSVRPSESLNAATTARLGPAQGAQPLFEIPEGALVNIIESSGSWICVVHEDNRGWIQRSRLDLKE